MILVSVGFKALRDAITNFQEAVACVLQLFLDCQSLIRLIKLLQCFFDWSHPFLAYAECFLVQIIILIFSNGDWLAPCSDVDRTL